MCNLINIYTHTHTHTQVERPGSVDKGGADRGSLSLSLKNTPTGIGVSKEAEREATRC